MYCSMTNTLVGVRRAASLFLFGVITLFVLGWCSLAFAQTATKPWRTVEELSAEERAELAFRMDTPRDAQIPYLPAEAYPFSPPYTAEELGYLMFELDTLRPRFSHIWLSTVQSMTAGGYMLILVAERMSRNEYPEDGRLGYTPLIVLYWTTDIDLMTAAFHDYHKKVNWLADHWETYFSAEFLRRGWSLSPVKTRGDIPSPDQFYLRPLLYPDKFPDRRRLALSPEVTARVAAQEAAGHVVFETNGQKPVASRGHP
jgi:hypothetical protein